MATAPTRRHTAAERREEILEAAMTEFATGGLHGASTDAIARAAGISQPYLFRLFGTKKELFLAVLDRGFARTLEAFQLGVGRASGAGENVFKTMGEAYVELLAGDRRILLCQLQGYVACTDPDIRTLVQKHYGELYSYARRASGGTDAELESFFATGMLINVVAAMDLPNLKEPWAQALLAACTAPLAG
jgi:AcrR family transcriptional regulator